MSLVPVTTDRLRLRALTKDDAGAAFAILGDARTTELVSWRQPSLESATAWVQRRRRDEARHGISMWAVEDRHTAEMVGLCGFFPKADRVAEMGYVIHAAHWVNGYGVEAAAAALSALGSGTGEWTVVATIRPFNTWSVNVATESGLRQVDRHSDDRGEMLVFAVAE